MYETETTSQTRQNRYDMLDMWAVGFTSTQQ